jgi:hypothetical protein
MVLKVDAGGNVEVVAKRRLTNADLRKLVMQEMFILRTKGLTDSEIAAKYRYRRETVNRMINSIPSDVKERLRHVRLV